jgi:DNA-binding response OmpR family regulator
MRLLIVEDDGDIAALVTRDLRSAGYTIDAVATAEHGLNAALDVAYAAIIIDLRLPDRDGMELVRDLRARAVQAPILILTGRRAIVDRVAGLGAGADDYLTKPFAMAELRARIQALLRRPSVPLAARIAFGDIAIDPAVREATVSGQPMPLSRQALNLLELLVQRGGHVTPKRVIEVSSNSVEVHIHHLRQALRNAGAEAGIETWRGVGYRLAKRPALVR